MKNVNEVVAKQPKIELTFPGIDPQTFSITLEDQDGVTYGSSQQVQFNVGGSGAPSGAVLVNSQNSPTFIATIEGNGYEFIDIMDPYEVVSGDINVLDTRSVKLNTKQMSFKLTQKTGKGGIVNLRFKVAYKKLHHGHH